MSKLPDPDTHCWDEDTQKDVWSYSKELVEQMLAQASAARIAAQTENETLKGKLAKSGLDARRKYEPLLKMALEAIDSVSVDYRNSAGYPAEVSIDEDALLAASDAIKKVLG